MPARYVPTDRDRAQVETMAGLGLTHDQMAVIVDCDPKTLRKCFKRELARGDARATMKVAGALFTAATAGRGKEAITAAIFWMKVRAGWSEKIKLDVAGHDGGPLKQTIEIVFGED